MRPELERLQRLEQHLLGPAAAATATADFLALDAAMPADAEAQRQVYHGLRQAGRQQLRQELAAIHEQLYGAGVGRWVWATAAGHWRLLFVRWRRLRAPF